MKRLACFGLSVLALLWSARPASATAIPYNSEAAFTAATGATLHALPTGPGNTPLVASSITTTDGQLTLSDLIPGNALISNWEMQPGVGVSRLNGPDLAISGFESFDATVAFSADRYAFGFGLYESTNPLLPGCNAPCVESTFTITLLNNLAAVAAFNLSPANDVALFWGVHTDFAFDAVQIRETTGSNDNEIFGTFYTGIRSVPEPGALLLLGTALAIRGVRRMTRRG
jgi:hypothetical protein